MPAWPDGIASWMWVVPVPVLFDFRSSSSCKLGFAPVPDFDLLLLLPSGSDALRGWEGGRAVIAFFFLICHMGAPDMPSLPRERTGSVANLVE